MWRIFKRQLEPVYGVEELITVDPNNEIQYHRVSTNRMPFDAWKAFYVQSVRELRGIFGVDISADGWTESDYSDLTQDDIAKGLLISK